MYIYCIIIHVHTCCRHQAHIICAHEHTHTHTTPTPTPTPHPHPHHTHTTPTPTPHHTHTTPHPQGNVCTYQSLLLTQAQVQLHTTPSLPHLCQPEVLVHCLRCKQDASIISEHQEETVQCLQKGDGEVVRTLPAGMSNKSLEAPTVTHCQQGCQISA